MPRYVHPRDTPPQKAQDAVDALGANPLRAAIVRHLVRHGPATTGETAEKLGTSIHNVRSHLNALERYGVVQADSPVGDRHGRRVRYTVDAQVLEAHLASYAAWLQGQ